MRPKHIFAILLIASLGLAGVLFLRARVHDRAAVPTAAVSEPAKAVARDEVLVAAHTLPQGLLLRAQDVVWRERNGDPQPGEIVRPSPEVRAQKPESDEAARTAVFGAALRANLREGVPIRRGEIVKPGDRDFLATVLSPGTRALTIPISATGGPGLMYAGDHVDVMLTQSFKNDEAPLTRRSVSETLVEDLRVLAIEQSKTPGRHDTLSVTLEVQPQQAERVNVAQELGKLSLTLRSLNEPAAISQAATPSQPLPAPAATWAGDASPALQSAMPPTKVIQAEKPAIKVMRGPNAVETRTQ